MDVKKRGPVAALAQGKTVPAGDTVAEEQQQALKKKKNGCDGLVGLVNIGNSCYMNATIQALSNCPPFRQYFIDCHPQPQSYSSPGPRAADSLSALFKKMWMSERHPGHLSPRQISSGMKNKLFRGSQQQDAQEFLRCLLTQIHDEIKITVPDSLVCGCGQVSCDQNCRPPPRDSMVSCTSHDSNTSAELLHQKVVVTNSAKNSPLLKKKAKHGSQKGTSHATTTIHGSPAIQPKFSFSKGKSKLLGASAGSKTSVESIPQLVSHHDGSKLSLEPLSSETGTEEAAGVQWSKDDLFVVDLIMRTVTVHRQYFATTMTTTKEEGDTGSLTSKMSELAVPPSRSRSSTPTLPHQQRHKQLGSKDSSSSISSTDSAQGRTDIPSEGGEYRETQTEGGGEKVEERLAESAENVEEVDGGKGSEERLRVAMVSGRGSSAPPSPAPSHQSSTSSYGGGGGGGGGVTLRERRKRVGPPRTTSIVNEVFEGVLESRVKCLACRKVSVTREPFQDLSLPIPGRKEIAKINSSKAEHGGEEKGGGEGESGRGRSSLSRGLSTVWNFMTALTRDYVTGPPTNIHDCLNAFFEASDLKGENKYYCCNCKSFQNSLKEMSIVRLPEVLCIHLKRFRFDTYLSTKISRHIAFPLTDLDLSPYLREADRCHGYNLNAVVTHYGGAGGGHYVAFAKNSLRNSWFEYNDTRIHPVSADTVLGAEGYVLFYKKASPNQSSHQPLDLTTFLPRAGTRLPSPDICYISRHWLYLLKHFSSPGPILQYEYACKHGAVVPEKAEGASSLAMCIRREVWEDLERKHGGGPLVPRLEACTVCQELLESLKVRRKTEKERVHQLQTQERQVEKDRKSEPYLLSIDWLQQWQKFIHCTTLEVEPPGPVDNTQLLQLSDEGGKVDLVDGALFRKLSPAAWKYFLHIYGGGPTIVTTLDALQ